MILTIFLIHFLQFWLPQLPIQEVRLQTDPTNARVRPLENITIQALVFGEIQDQEGNSEKVRLQVGGAEFRVKDGEGWLSKPFRYQGEEKIPFYQEHGAGLASILMDHASSKFVLQDSVLYTAPDRAGTFEITAELNGKPASVLIHVDPEAPAVRESESKTFGPPQLPGDPYRKLAEHYSPFIAQETWFQPKADYIARFDYDGDWKGDNNWESLNTGSSQAYVYYAVMETSTHWFLIYNIFHPRDYSDKCVAGTCHENDNEGLILTIAKNDTEYGSLQVMETLAHNNIYSYRHDRRVRNNVHGIDDSLEIFRQSHPVVFIESGGHGVYGSRGSHSRYNLKEDHFTAGTGVTYLYRGKAERPENPNDRLVGYQLLPIWDHWWNKAQKADWSRGYMFDDYFRYEPKGSRPTPGYTQIAGAFFGKEHGQNKAKPFWGWHDMRTRKKNVLATGQWGLDPAYSVYQNLRMPEPFSLDYVFNPYLGYGKRPMKSRAQVKILERETTRSGSPNP
jgi:hypothetical protein